MQLLEIAAKFIEYFEREIAVDQLLDDVVKTGYKHGTAGFKICYDPDDDIVTWTPVSIFDYLVDSADRDDDRQWVIFQTYLDPFEAQALLESAGIDDTPGIETYKVNKSEDREGTLVLELWHKPTARIPSGLYCKVIGNHVLDAGNYPYAFGPLENPEGGKPEYLLPLVTCKISYVRGSSYGDTSISDVIPIQRNINEVAATLIALRRKAGTIKAIVASDEIAKQFGNRDQIIVHKDPSAPAVSYAPVPQISPILFNDREYFFKRFYDVVGLNEVLTGAESVKSGTSGKQIAYMNELDAMKHAGTSKSIETMILRAYRLTLGLVQKYYLTERLMRIVDDTGVRTQLFRGSDVAGIDISIEPRTGMARYHANKIAQAEQDAAAQLVPADVLMERRVTGQDGTMFERNQRHAVQQQIKYLLEGATELSLDNIDPSIAVDEIDRTVQYMITIQPGRQDLQAALQALKQEFAGRIQPEQTVPGEVTT